MALGQKLKTTQPSGAATVAARGNHLAKRGGVDVNEDGVHYAVNGWSGASSDTKIGTTRADLSVNNDDTDAALNMVKTRGAGRSDAVENWQTREIGAAGKHNVPTHAGTSGASKGGTVPDRIGASQGEPVRKA